MDVHVRWLNELGACPIPCLLSSIARCADATNLPPHIGGHSWEYPVAIFPTYSEHSRLDFGFGFNKGKRSDETRLVKGMAAKIPSNHTSSSPEISSELRSMWGFQFTMMYLHISRPSVASQYSICFPWEIGRYMCVLCMHTYAIY